MNETQNVEKKRTQTNKMSGKTKTKTFKFLVATTTKRVKGTKAKGQREISLIRLTKAKRETKQLAYTRALFVTLTL